MKIDPISLYRTGTVRKGSRARGAGGASFADEIAEETATSAVAAPVTSNGVEALLALQEVPGDEVKRQPPRARGDAVLDQLEEVRVGLLLGFIPRERLERLGRLVENMRGSASDPRLAEILGEIELRARVELEKLKQLS